jgi:ERCC4-type nuclease
MTTTYGIERQELRFQKIVDSREVAEARVALMELGWQQRQLQSGDYCFWTCQNHSVGITRKTTSDFLSSIGDEFGYQLEVMLDRYDICILLIEEPWNWIDSNIITDRGISKVTKKAALNYIHRWQGKGFILERTADLSDTILRLNELYAFYQQPYSLSARSKGYADERLLALPSGLRGKSGERLLASHSIREIANMIPREIIALGIEGIGETRATLCYQHFNKGDKNYGND